MTSKKPNKERKIFLNCMNSWLSNFIIEEFRTDYLPDAKIKNSFMGERTIAINLIVYCYFNFRGENFSPHKVKKYENV